MYPPNNPDTAPPAQRETTQAERDAITYDMYVDCGLHARETAHQSGIAVSTVRARVRRHARRLSERDVASRAGG